jgi:hypothetical protein
MSIDTTLVKYTFAGTGSSKCHFAVHLSGLVTSHLYEEVVNLRGAIEAASALRVLEEALIPADTEETGTTSSLSYGSPEDRVKLVFSGGTTGQLTKLNAPCPRPSMLVADTTQLDTTKTAVQTLLTELEADARGTGAETLTRVSSLRSRVKKHKKL